MEIDPKIIVFVSTLIPTLITLYLTERIKGNIKSNFDEKLEKLKKEHTIEISKFESELDILKTKENFKFTKLHEKRMDILEKTYKYLNESLLNLNQYVVPLKQIGEGITFEENEKLLHENFRTAQNNFANYFADNKIYYDDEIEKLIDSYMTEAIEVYNDYYENYFLKELSGSFNPESHVKASVAYKKIFGKIVPIKKQIEQKFKELLEK